MDPIGVKDELRHLLGTPREDLRDVDAVPVPAAMAAATESAASARHDLRPSKLSFLQFAIRCDDRLASGMSSKAIDNEKAKYEFGEQI